jgi:cell division protein FtsN
VNRRCLYFAGVFLTLDGALTGAQMAPRPMDPVFLRAQQLVSDGNGAAGRALIDSVIKSNSPTSQIYPQALFWRATLAASAADAESDYKHIVVDFPLAPQAEEALLRLAQLELARGDRDAALSHLERIPRDYPHSNSLARANYWTARVFFEKNDLAHACAANANAQSQVPAAEVELQNQIQYQAQRCVSYNAERSAVTTASSTPSIASSVDSAPSTRASAPAAAPAAVAEAAGSTPSAGRENDTITRSAQAKEHSAPVVRPSAARPPAAAGARTRSVFSVQVAAYTKRPQAEELASALVKRGYAARVDGEAAPFRVRIGRYETEREAEVALKQLKAKHMDGFVTEAAKR